MNRVPLLLALSGVLLMFSTACAGPESLGSAAATTVTVEVSAYVAGISSEETEALLTIPLERVLAKTPSLHQLRSRSAHGQCTIWVELKETLEKAALRLVQNQIAKAQGSLPAEVSGLVVVVSANPWTGQVQQPAVHPSTSP